MQHSTYCLFGEPFAPAPRVPHAPLAWLRDVLGGGTPSRLICFCDGPSSSASQQRVSLQIYPASTHMHHRPESEYGDGDGPPGHRQEPPKPRSDTRLRLFPSPPGTDDRRKKYDRQGGRGHVPQPPSVLTQHNRRRRRPGRDTRLSPRAAVAPWTAKERYNQSKSTGGVQSPGDSDREKGSRTTHNSSADDESAIIPHHDSNTTDGDSTSESSHHHGTRLRYASPIHDINGTRFSWPDSNDDWPDGFPDEPSDESDRSASRHGHHSRNDRGSLSVRSGNHGRTSQQNDSLGADLLCPHQSSQAH